jgi:hypothetical protein
MDPYNIVNFPVTTVPECTGSNAKTLGLQHLSFLIWERAADLQVGHAKSIMGRMSCLYSTTPFLMEKPLLLFRRGPSTSGLCASFFLT